MEDFEHQTEHFLFDPGSNREALDLSGRKGDMVKTTY